MDTSIPEPYKSLGLGIEFVMKENIQEVRTKQVASPKPEGNNVGTVIVPLGFWEYSNM